MTSVTRARSLCTFFYQPCRLLQAGRRRGAVQLQEALNRPWNRPARQGQGFAVDKTQKAQGSKGHAKAWTFGEWDDVVNELQAKHALIGFTFLKNSNDLFLVFKKQDKTTTANQLRDQTSHLGCVLPSA